MGLIDFAMPKVDHLLFDHQRGVFESLLATAKVYFSGTWRALPIAPRWARLVVGPTGCGKSHLIRRLAKTLSVPLLEIAATNWLPLGASNRGGRSTWPLIVEFCQLHKRGIIFFDEVDKLDGKSDWSTFIRVEAFALLDQRVPDIAESYSDSIGDNGAGLSGRQIKLARLRLARSILIVGAGAFQSLWRAQTTGQIGFMSDAARNEPLELRELASVIPPEIANRFAGPVLSLRMLEEKDYRAMLASLLPILPFNLRHMVQSLGEQKLAQAVANQVGCRWIQELLLHALIQHARFQNQDPRPARYPRDPKKIVPPCL